MKSIFEQLGGTYHEENGYLIPDLGYPSKKNSPIFAAIILELAYSIWLLYHIPHVSIALIIGRIDSPSLEREYSTLGGTSANTVRITIPSLSIERRLSVNTFWLMPSNDFCNSLNRHGRSSRFRIINNFHLLPINWTVVATGQIGNSSFFIIRHSISNTTLDFNATSIFYCKGKRNSIESAKGKKFVVGYLRNTL